MVLKGHQTLIGRSAGEVSVNPSGNPYLAQGGSGDVLAGYLAGLLAQPALRADRLRPSATPSGNMAPPPIGSGPGSQTGSWKS